MKTHALATAQHAGRVIVLAITTAILSTPATADWDAAEEARYQAAQKKARAENARAADEAKKQREQRLREHLGAAPYKEDPKRLAALNEAQLITLRDQRYKEDAERASRQRKQASKDMIAAIEGMTPEQRAMIERASGKKMSDVLKEAQRAAK